MCIGSVLPRWIPRIWRLFAGCCVFFLVGLCGCQSERSPTAATLPTLRFDQPSVDLGQRRDRAQVTQVYPFRVWDKTAIKIVGVKTTCGCFVADESLLKRELPAGSRHDLRLTLSVNESVSKSSIFATIMTDPPCETPLLIAAHYRYVGPPRASVSTLLIEGVPQELAQESFVVSQQRLASEASLTLDRAKFKSADLEFVNVNRDSKPMAASSANDQAAILDQFTIKVRAKSLLNYGDHRSYLRLSWSDSSVTELPCVIRIARPWEPQMDRVFAGILKPNARWSVTIPCRLSKTRTLKVHDIKTTLPTVRAEVSEDLQKLIISGQSPSAKGRFGGQLTVTFEPDTIPALELPFTGFVKD